MGIYIIIISKMGFNRMNFFFLFVIGFLVSMAHAKVHHYTFVLQETNFTKLCSTKSILTVNGSFPGPKIHVRKGDTAFVKVDNQGTYGVTMHWHGVAQPRNPWSDGPENITQCPIPAGTSFTYEVIFSSEEGTLWWHAHSDWTRATVHGAIIISPALGTKYPFPKPYAEEVIVLASWFIGDVMEIINEAQAVGGDPNISDAFTINGQPGDLYNCSKESTYRLTVRYGKTYLLRIINAVMNEEQFFGIANHSLTVVGSDSAYLKPITANYIMISPGQTMDVLVTANQSPSQYYIASSPYADTPAPFDETMTTAIFQYTGNYTPPSTPPLPSLPLANDTDSATNFTNLLRSLASVDHPINVPTKVDHRIFMTVSVNQLPCPNASCDGPDNNRAAASLNNISFIVPPKTDILQAYYKNLSDVYESNFPKRPGYIFNFTGDVGNNTIFPSQGTRVKVLKYGEAVEIVFQGTNIGASENHPMHLHGTNFYVVGSGFGNFDNETDPESYNLIDPPDVNTIGVPKLGWTVIRFYATNPGVWFMHCHLERHSTWGMNMVIIVKNGGTNETNLRPPPSYMPPCTKP